MANNIPSAALRAATAPAASAEEADADSVVIALPAGQRTTDSTGTARGQRAAGADSARGQLAADNEVSADSKRGQDADSGQVPGRIADGVRGQSPTLPASYSVDDSGRTTLTISLSPAPARPASRLAPEASPAPSRQPTPAPEPEGLQFRSVAGTAAGTGARGPVRRPVPAVRPQRGARAAVLVPVGLVVTAGSGVACGWFASWLPLLLTGGSVGAIVLVLLVAAGARKLAEAANGGDRA